jgi:DNA primase
MYDLQFRGLIEHVRERVDIVQVIKQRINLNDHNMAECPFHDDKKPSFSVNPRGQYFHCFGCGAGGDVFEFLMRVEHKTFMEALTDLARQVGIPLPGFTREDRKQIVEARRIQNVLASTAKFYQSALSITQGNYLDTRGLGPKIVGRFLIGYANGGLQEHLTHECKFPVDLCLRAGVLRRTKDGAVVDYFMNRIIFPNLRHGRVVHLTGRSLDHTEPKYRHLPGGIHYLFNEDTLSSKSIFIVEGVFDCHSLVQAGFPAVALFGTNLKKEFVEKFSRCSKIFICLDGDEAGRKAALKIGKLFGEKARIVNLPPGSDPNSFCTEHSKDEFRDLVRRAKDVITYQITHIPKDIGRVSLEKRLRPILKELARKDKTTSEAYLQEVIKPRFKLNKAELSAYRATLSQYERAQKKATQMKSTPGPGGTKCTAYFEGLVDLVEHEGSPAFLIKKGDDLSIVPQVTLDGEVHFPPPKEGIPWLLPRGEAVLQIWKQRGEYSVEELDGQLFDDLKTYHKRISRLPGPAYYDLIAAWDLHTYHLEGAQYSPTICLFAVPERGKTRTGKGMINVAYRGLRVESLREAFIFRAANDLRATLFFDVRDIWKKAVRSESEDILLNRFERGTTVPRVLYPDRGAHHDIVYYLVFGPTIVGTNEGLDDVLETRCITLNMPQSRRLFDEDLSAKAALPLKERLLAFRARHLGQLLPEVEKPAIGRLGDILKPLRQILQMVKPKKENSLLTLVEDLESARTVEKLESFEADILRAVIAAEKEESERPLTVKLIREKYNSAHQDQRREVTPHWIGRRLSAMGLKKRRGTGGLSTVIWEDKLIHRLCDTYGVEEPKTEDDLVSQEDWPTDTELPR